MNTTQAQQSIKNLHSEAFSLNPSALVILFEIDISNIGFDRGIISKSEVDRGINTVFRFHNNPKLGINSIFWQGKEYFLVPVQAEGFEISGKGTLPTPKLSISTSDEGVAALSILKDKIFQYGDLVGAKVTRIRTFAKFIDSVNFLNDTPPDGFNPDFNSEFPRDIFYIERKSLENKNIIEFELSSLLDIENIQLPGRLVTQGFCPFAYRGEGCLYEYNARRNVSIHGEATDSTLPQQAPPIATINDELIIDLLGDIPINDRGEYNRNVTYNKGDFVYIEYNNLKYYFVGRVNNITKSPPDSSQWLADTCSKKTRGCFLRFGNIGDGRLPIGAFPSVSRYV